LRRATFSSSTCWSSRRSVSSSAGGNLFLGPVRSESAFPVSVRSAGVPAGVPLPVPPQPFLLGGRHIRSAFFHLPDSFSRKRLLFRRVGSACFSTFQPLMIWLPRFQLADGYGSRLFHFHGFYLFAGRPLAGRTFLPCMKSLFQLADGGRRLPVRSRSTGDGLLPPSASSFDRAIDGDCSLSFSCCCTAPGAGCFLLRISQDLVFLTDGFTVRF